MSLRRRSISSLSIAAAVSLGLLGPADAAPRKPRPGVAMQAAHALTSAPRTTLLPLDPQQSPEGLKAQVRAAKAACERDLATVAALKPEQRTFANTVEALEEAVARFVESTSRLTIWKELHTDKAVRDAAGEAEELSSQFLVQVASRRDLYAAIKAWQEGPGKSAKLDAQQARLLELTLRDFRRSGLALDDARLARLVELRTKLASLQVEFSKNLNEDITTLAFSRDQLAGMTEGWLGRLKRDAEGRYLVTTKYPDYFPLMEGCKVAESRRRMYLAFNTRQAEGNTRLLAEAVRLRDEAARLLGYTTHADYVAEDRMSGKAATVRGFLEPLVERMRPRRDADYARMAALKAAETGEAGATLQPWDFAYYLAEWKRADYTLDDEEIRQFFPAERVVPAMFGVYEELMGVKIRPVDGAQVWHPDVKLYVMEDADDGKPMGWFYADLFPREGKFGHAAVAGLSASRELAGRYNAPLAVLMANFTPPSGDKPGLLTHGEVRTLFHEFGHICHQLLTRARYASQAGTNVAGDFVEAPSQMLENWVFEPAVLDRISGHWQEPSRKLPKETIERLRAARTFDAGYKYTRQLFLASFDHALHTGGGEVDPGAVELATYRAIMGVVPPAEQRMGASFGHLMGGYDAGYYGYLWSEVFAADMFSRFASEGVMNGRLGRRYRETILAKGRSVDPSELLKEFLGREPSQESFLKRLGLRDSARPEANGSR